MWLTLSDDQSPERIGPSSFEKLFDAAQFVGREIVQALGANLAQVHFMQHGMKQPVLAGQQAARALRARARPARVRRLRRR